MSIPAPYIIYTLAALLVAFFVTRFAFSLKAYFEQRGKRLIVCPENRKHAAVELNAALAAEKAFFGSHHFRLRTCSRWPEKEDCGQECLKQIELAPDECLVKNFVARWYEGKKCVYCGKLIPAGDWLGHKPALMNRDKKTIYWDIVAPEMLPEVFGNCTPVCWDCHITESFRREHPELVVDRPPH
ncbi:MAG TPA: hypothetical protein VFM21_08110 [Terriglobia bacterium]|nr:hypothetical protein [Terriglobia bacterium]